MKNTGKYLNELLVETNCWSLVNTLSQFKNLIFLNLHKEDFKIFIPL